MYHLLTYIGQVPDDGIAPAPALFCIHSWKLYFYFRIKRLEDGSNLSYRRNTWTTEAKKEVISNRGMVNYQKSTFQQKILPKIKIYLNGKLRKNVYYFHEMHYWLGEIFTPGFVILLYVVTNSRYMYTTYLKRKSAFSGFKKVRAYLLGTFYWINHTALSFSLYSRYLNKSLQQERETQT